MGSYCSVVNDISDAEEVWMQFSANCAEINWQTSSGFHRISRGSSHQSDKQSLSLLLQINIIVLKKEGSSRFIKYKGTMDVRTGATDDSTETYRASDIPLRRLG